MSTTPKQIIFEEEARQLLQNGIKKLADVVSFTLGPKGRNVGLEKSWGAPMITNDGSSIIKDIELKDTFENMGVQMAKEVVQKIKEKAGDGTTTGTLLLSSLVENGNKLIATGASPIGLKRGIEKAVDVIIKEIEKLAKPVTNAKERQNIATVSASGNEEIGKLISDAMEKVGQNGVITIEEAKGVETTIDVVEGMRFDRGYISPYFATNPEKMTVEFHNNPRLLLVDRKISNIHELLPLLETLAKTGSEFVIIAEDVEGDVLSTLVVNKLRGSLKVVAVKAPGFGDRRKAMLGDIAALTGAQVISEDAGISFKDFPLSHLGSANQIIITKDHTTIISEGHEDATKARIKQIEAEIKEITSSYDKEKLEERKAHLSGGVAIIRIGAATEPELKEKKQHAEDSLNSTKAAIESGTVPGGGVALLRASKAIETMNLSGDEKLGAGIVYQACRTPLKQIVNNAGQDGSVILAQIEKDNEANLGFNTQTDKIEDMVKAGVIDPAKVIIIALQHASSVAVIALLSEALIADAKEDEGEEG